MGSDWLVAVSMCSVLSVVRVVLILAGLAAMGLIMRYDLRDMDGGLAFLAIAAQTLAVTYLILVHDVAEIRIVQNVAVIMLYVVIVSGVWRSRRQAHSEEDLISAILRRGGPGQ